MSWNTRAPKLEDERRYQHLIEIHQLTQTWLNELAPKSPAAATESHRLERFIPPNLVQNLWLLEKVRLDQLAPQLESVIDATTVTEFLSHLEEDIWLVQMAVIDNALKNTSDPAGLTNLLEQTSWQYGKTIAEKNWPFFEANQKKLEEWNAISFFKALHASPLAGAHDFLIERQIPLECSFFWVKSPLARPSLKLNPQVFVLCQLYHQFLRGFFYGLSRSLTVEVTPTSLGNQKTWRINLLLSY
jgi:hypothetical protein